MANSNSRKNLAGRPSFDEVLATLDEEVRLLHAHLGGLARAVEADHILREIWIDDVHNSTAIEGNTMTRAQVEGLVERKKVTGTAIEILEVEGYARAADWVYRTATGPKGVPVSVLSEIHRQTVGPAWVVDPPPTRDRPGAWRSTGVAVRGLTVAVPPVIAAELSDWSASTRALKRAHPVVHCAEHHAWFERIHPFIDGNGRVGRLVLNFMLIQHGYPPAVILASQRTRYLQALRQADFGNPKPLAEVVARAVRGALSRFLIPKLAGEAKLVPLAALAAQGFYSPAYLRQLAQSGRLKAVQEGRLWLSSRAWLEEYIGQRDPRGGPPGGRSRS